MWHWLWRAGAFVKQRVIYSTHVADWDDFDLPGEVFRRFGTHSIMDRDTMVGALGEGFHGAGKGTRPIFYITLSTGIGGGFLDENGLFRGADSFACELGHHTVVPDGLPCLCGSSGCLERMCSGFWLERDYGKSVKELMQDAQFIEKYVVFLARGLKNCIMFFDLLESSSVEELQLPETRFSCHCAKSLRVKCLPGPKLVSM